MEQWNILLKSCSLDSSLSQGKHVISQKEGASDKEDEKAKLEKPNEKLLSTKEKGKCNVELNTLEQTRINVGPSMQRKTP